MANVCVSTLDSDESDKTAIEGQRGGQVKVEVIVRKMNKDQRVRKVTRASPDRVSPTPVLPAPLSPAP